MDLNSLVNRYLKISKKSLSEKDHEFITVLFRMLQEDVFSFLHNHLDRLNGIKDNDIETIILDMFDFVKSSSLSGGKDGNK